jgi:hypothetical protein
VLGQSINIKKRGEGNDGQIHVSDLCGLFTSRTSLGIRQSDEVSEVSIKVTNFREFKRSNEVTKVTTTLLFVFVCLIKFALTWFGVGLWPNNLLFYGHTRLKGATARNDARRITTRRRGTGSVGPHLYPVGC